ncbi:MAG: TolC family protein [Pyrinomonadaceae bacterium]|nr:TolC family protein [Pyrinomonadaceae bacterium]
MSKFRYLIVFSFLALAAASLGAQVPVPSPETVAVPSIAPDYRSDDRRLPELGRVGVDIADQRTLTLSEAIELALANNRDIEISRKAVTMAEFDLKATRGAFQARLTGQAYYDRATTPNVSIFSSNQKTTVGTLFGAASISAASERFGTTATATATNQHLTTDNPISILSPQLNASLGLSVLQPLFRGRKTDVARRSLAIAKRNIELTDTQFRQRSIETIATVEKAYWDLMFALRNLQVQRDAVRDAKSQLEHNRRLVDEGQLAPIDIVAADTQVANFEQAVYDALNVVNQAENALKMLLSPNRHDPLWARSLTPVEPVELTVPDPTLTQAIDTALAQRPELDINRTQKEINLIDQKLFKDQTKPQIDFTASITETGIGGSANPNFSPNFPTACQTNPNSPACQQQQANLAMLMGNPYRGVFTHRYPVFRVGVSFNIPLPGDKAAKAQLGRARVEAERLDLQREQIEQGIQVEVRNALQSVRTAEARLRAAAIARENLVRQYDSESRKMLAGQSDVYRVLERQTALAAAQSNELRSRTELNKAIAELQRAMGNTLKANNIELK